MPNTPPFFFSQIQIQSSKKTVIVLEPNKLLQRVGCIFDDNVAVPRSFAALTSAHDVLNYSCRTVKPPEVLYGGSAMARYARHYDTGHWRAQGFSMGGARRYGEK